MILIEAILGTIIYEIPLNHWNLLIDIAQQLDIIIYLKLVKYHDMKYMVILFWVMKLKGKNLIMINLNYQLMI